MASATGGKDFLDRGSRFRGLDNYTDYPSLQTTQKKRKNNGFESIDPKTGFLVPEKNFAEYYIVQRIDSNNATFENLSPFFVQKALTTQIGANHETKRLRDGTLLVKCKNDKQANALLGFNSNLFGNEYKVKVIEHISLNTVQGLVYCWDAKRLTEEEILEGLADEKVVAVRKMKRKEVGGALVDTALIVLTFKRSILPKSIMFGFIPVLVKPYIPNPMKCLNCFRFGHTRKHCKQERLCAQCSDLYHEGSTCKTGSRCVNCKDHHNNWNKECPQFKREVAIQTIKIQEKISYFEARKKHDSLNLPASPSHVSQSSFSKTLSSPPSHIMQTQTHANVHTKQNSNTITKSNQLSHIHNTTKSVTLSEIKSLISSNNNINNTQSAITLTNSNQSPNISSNSVSSLKNNSNSNIQSTTPIENLDYISPPINNTNNTSHFSDSESNNETAKSRKSKLSLSLTLPTSRSSKEWIDPIDQMES